MRWTHTTIPEMDVLIRDRGAIIDRIHSRWRWFQLARKHRFAELAVAAGGAFGRLERSNQWRAVDRTLESAC